MAFAVALASLSSVGPVRLRTLLSGSDPVRAWEQVTKGDRRVRAATSPEGGSATWRRASRSCGPETPLIRTGSPTTPAPRRFSSAWATPAVLSGSPTVALVGTRAPTRYGIGVAAQFGADLAATGVSVVSGLALGIDGAAHEGACGAGAPPIAVVAGGLDRPYPQRHERLWSRVAAAGAIVSESPAGVPTQKWRFPVRNRLLAALSDAVVVVESRHSGGSRHTVDAALERGVPVGAVPGSIRSATSEGTNALLADGAFPACSAADILLALALDGSGSPPVAAGRPATPERRPPEVGPDRVVYEALCPDPTSLEELARVTGMEFGALCGGLERLAGAGLARDAGGWWERA